MWFFNRKKPTKRRVFGFLCDPSLALAVKFIAHDLQCPIYPVAEHLLQLGAALVLPALEDEELKKELQEHLVREHLLVPTLDGQSEYDRATMAEALTKKQD